MTMKLEPTNLFHTPENMEELQQRVQSLHSSERTVALLFMGMTWNLCAKLTSSIQEEDDEVYESS